MCPLSRCSLYKLFLASLYIRPIRVHYFKTYYNEMGLYGFTHFSSIYILFKMFVGSHTREFSYFLFSSQLQDYIDLFFKVRFLSNNKQNLLQTIKILFYVRIIFIFGFLCIYVCVRFSRAQLLSEHTIMHRSLFERFLKRIDCNFCLSTRKVLYRMSLLSVSHFNFHNIIDEFTVFELCWRCVLLDLIMFLCMYSWYNIFTNG